MKNHLLNNSLAELIGVSFSYNEKKNLINKIDLSVKSGGDIVCLLGPSGSGKTTVLKLLLKEIEPNNGVIQITRNHLPIYQDFERMILPWFKVEKNITYGIKNFQINIFNEVISLLEINDLIDSYPFELSGGEKQRVIFARALIRRPEILIVDEPLSSIDIGLSKRMMPSILSYLKSNQISALWVTHDVTEAISISDVIMVINGEGKIIKLPNDKNVNNRELALKIQDNLL